jgi:multiple sugar transport system permease protein
LNRRRPRQDAAAPQARVGRGDDRGARPTAADHGQRDQIPQEVDDAAKVDGATGIKKLIYVTLLLQLPIALVAILFGIVFTATDMAVVYILTNGGPFNSTQVVTTWAFQQGIQGGSLGEGAAVPLFLLPVLALVAITMLFFARRAEVA